MNIKEKKGRGRPKGVVSLEELTNKISEYFDNCKNSKGRYTSPPTKYGLAKHLGVSFQTLLNWEVKGHEYLESIKEAKYAIEDAWVKKLWEPYPTGAIFYLKNAYKDRWRDRYDHTSDGAAMPAAQIIVYSENDRLKQIMEKRKK